MRVFLGAFALVVALVDGASAQTLDTGRAQGEMYRRIQAATDAYARSLDLGDVYISYCQTRLTLETAHQPTDGLTPYGVNYNSITTQQRLDDVIAIREAFETVYLRLCLADAKASLLRAAGQ